MSINEIVPNQPEDFIREVDPLTGQRVITKYQGPIYQVHYPAGLNRFAEMFAWERFGYQLPSEISGDRSKGFTLTVMGDIPEWLQDRLRESQVRIELQKPRGPVVSLNK